MDEQGGTRMPDDDCLNLIHIFYRPRMAGRCECPAHESTNRPDYLARREIIMDRLEKEWFDLVRFFKRTLWQHS